MNASRPSYTWLIPQRLYTLPIYQSYVFRKVSRFAGKLENVFHHVITNSNQGDHQRTIA
jgi:hypothetical protein